MWCGFPCDCGARYKTRRQLAMHNSWDSECPIIVERRYQKYKARQAQQKADKASKKARKIAKKMERRVKLKEIFKPPVTSPRNRFNDYDYQRRLHESTTPMVYRLATVDQSYVTQKPSARLATVDQSYVTQKPSAPPLHEL